MQKMTRVVLAVLTVAGTTAAMAQSSVTLYGRVNTTVERQKLGDVSSTGMFNNSSRFGFKGTEDLGGGLRLASNWKRASTPTPARGPVGPTPPRA